MPKWDIDRSLKQIETENGKCAGTIIERAMVDVAIMKQKGVEPTPEDIERGFGRVWCIGVGITGMPKAFFYGHTIRAAFLRALKSAKAGTLAQHTPWGVQHFQPNFKKAKRRDRRGKPKKKSASAGAVP